MTASATGGATVNFTVPASAPAGTCTVVFSGLLGGAAASASVSFVVTRASDNSGLPTTGSSDIVPLTGLGLGLLVAGGGIVLLTRRRRLAGDTAA